MMVRFTSYNAKIEYLEIPKAASTSIKAALLMADGVKWEKEIQVHVHNHFKEISHVVPSLCFTFVRNPLERFISCFIDKSRNGYFDSVMKWYVPIRTIEEFSNYVWHLIKNGSNNDPHLRPQVDILRKKYKVKGDWDIAHREVVIGDSVYEVPVEIYPFELLNAGWKKLQAHVENSTIGKAKLPDLQLLNKTKYDGEVEVPDKVKDIITTLYADDFKLIEEVGDAYE